MATRKNMILPIDISLSGKRTTWGQIFSTYIGLDSVKFSPFAPAESLPTKISICRLLLMKIHAQMYSCQVFTSSVVECTSTV